MIDNLLERIRAREACVGVIGLGYVGLPLVRAFSQAGFPVTGFDVDPQKVAVLAGGGTYIGHFPAELVGSLVAEGRFEPTTDFDRLAGCDAIVICVPTPLTPQREPDTSYIRQTAGDIQARLRRGQLVVLESTTYPGTMDDLVKPILESSGLACGTDFFLAYSPEREDPGNERYTTSVIPKVVGADDPDSLRLAEALYGAIVDKVVPVSSMRAAEATKITENIYRAVNIALVNELKVLFTQMGIDVWEVIDAAATKPFGFQPFYPGPGLGGHCIPVDPFYLTWKAREYEHTTRFIELAGEINTSMPAYVIARLVRALNDRGKAVNGARVLVLGVAYKPGVDDDRESPSYKLIDQLQDLGAVVSYNDPYIPKLRPGRRYDLGLESTDLTAATIAAQDCVLVATAHEQYDWPEIVRHAQLVVDTRNATAGITEGREKVVKA